MAVKTGHWRKRLGVTLPVIFVLVWGVLTVAAWKIRQDTRAMQLPECFGYRYISMQDSEMATRFTKGSLLALENTDTEHQVGDLIAYYPVTDGEAQWDNLRVRRVFQVDTSSGQPLYTVKGDDSKRVEEYAVINEMIAGDVAWHVPFFGSLMEYLKTREGVLFTLVVPGIVFLLVELFLLFPFFKGKKQEEEPVSVLPNDGDEHFVDVTDAVIGKGKYKSSLRASMEETEHFPALEYKLPVQQEAVEDVAEKKTVLVQRPEHEVQTVVIPASAGLLESRPEPEPPWVGLSADNRLRISVSGKEIADLPMGAIKDFRIKSGDYTVSITISENSPNR